MSLTKPIKKSSERVVMTRPKNRKGSSINKNSSEKNKTNINQLNDPTSWCSNKSQIFDEKSMPSPLSKSSRTDSTDVSPTTMNSDTNSSFYKNPIVDKLKNPTVELNNHTWSSSSQNTDVKLFLLRQTTTNDSISDSLNSQENESNISNDHCIFEHRFHVSENIEHNSPWVRHRSKEIFEHVYGLPETCKYENQTEESSRDSKMVSGDRSKTDDDNATYEIANKMYGLLTDNNKMNNDDDTTSSENEYSHDDCLRWTKLYQKLVKNNGKF